MAGSEDPVYDSLMLSHLNASKSIHNDITAVSEASLFQTPISSPKVIYDQQKHDELHELLKGYAVYDESGKQIPTKQRLKWIDECISIITNEWDDILDKKESDIQTLLANKHQHINELYEIYKDDLYEQLYSLSLQIKKMNFIINQQEMIYLPREDDLRNKIMSIHLETEEKEKLINSESNLPVAQLQDTKSPPSALKNAHDYEYRLYVLRHPNKYKDKVIENDDNKLDRDEYNEYIADSVNHQELETSLDEDSMHEEISQLSVIPKDRRCQGCRHRIKMNIYYEDAICYKADIVPDVRFCFHDQYCVTLRRLKESIRKFVLDQLMADNHTANSNVSEYVENLKHYFDSLITFRGKTIKPMAKDEGEIKMKARGRKKNDHEEIATNISDEKGYSNDMMYIAMHAHKLKLTSKNKTGSNKFKHIPSAIKSANMLIYGKSLGQFIMNQLSTRQLDSLWLLLAYIMQEMPTVSAIKILDENRSQLSKVQNVDNLEAVLTAVIQCSTYTIAAALYLSAMMTEVAQRDLSRSDDFDKIANKYVDIALNLANNVESDHLLSILLETPTDIAQQSAFQIALKHKIHAFMDNSRIQMLLVHMFSEFDYLNPHKVFRTTDISLYESLVKLVNEPARFYYCPVGRYGIESIMYVMYVCMVTFIVYHPPFIEQEGQRHFHNLTLNLATIEVFMWICNAGYAFAEITQMVQLQGEYLTDVGNAFDGFIVINWIIIAIVRFGCIGVNVTDYATDSCYDNNGAPVMVHMFVFCIQIVILWSRIALIFTTNRMVGPFISMIPGMVRDIFNWMFVLSIFFVGFAFGANFIIAGDISEECGVEDGSLDSFSLVFEYVFILLMGQSEWSVLNQNDCMTSPARALLLKLVMWIFSVMGTILLLNLLIAMMASTYERMREEKASQVSFARAQEIYTLAYRSAIISPPLNVVVYGIGIIWVCLELLILFCSKRKYAINLRKLIPVSVDYHSKARKKNLNANPEKSEFKTKCYGLLLEMKENYDQSAKWCRFCRCYMRETVPGTLRYYFSLFRNYRLDDDDKRLITVLIQPNGICPECFRPYKIKRKKGLHSTNRLRRTQIVSEMLSFYVFMALMYIPFLILLLLPAIFVGIYRLITNITASQLNENDNLMIISDDRYIRKVNEAIGDDTCISDQIKELKDTLQERLDFINAKMDQSLFKITSQSNTLHKYTQSIHNKMDYISELDENKQNKQNKEEEKEEKEVISLKTQMEKLDIIKQAEDKKIQQQIAMNEQFDNDINKIRSEMYTLRVNNENDDTLHIKLDTLKMKKQKSIQQINQTKEKTQFVDIQHNELKNKLQILLKKKTEHNKTIANITKDNDSTD